MKELRTLLIDGQDSADRWPLDRGLQFGDGLFETMTVRDGRVRWLAQHQLRLGRGCERLGFAVDQARVWAEVREAAATAGEATFKLLITRGNAVARGYSPTGSGVPRRFLYMFDAQPAPLHAAPFRVVRLGALLGESPLLAGLKHCNRLEQVLGRMELQGRDADEGLMASSSGLLISGTMTNVFLRLKGQWHTPRVERCGVAGVMRAIVLREALHLGQPAQQSDLPADCLEHCEELFVTNVRFGVQPVTHLEGRALPVGAGVTALRKHVGELDE